ncbi:hypothetical protein [Clostridium aminobutyricum]|uniref:Uncharacterized protein n=1 Tax=Clostridium aminobutyricum TaxID=33953 RepID=A0A939IG70_CLOAM|nr:hypothetical protein [Clostridium aminobutyricum]MBN7772750.1 hypothetical protein [Clostridium aminobutyricum]
MKRRNSKYNKSYYWEELLGREDVWKDMLVPPDKMSEPVFINACLIDKDSGLIDNNWACYPDANALLGFIKYVFLPTVSYYMINTEREDIYTPVSSFEEFLDYIKESSWEDKHQMVDFAWELDGFWDMEQQESLHSVRQFCRKFNAFWSGKEVEWSIQIFFDTYEVGGYIKELIWCEELFKEDVGLSFQQLDDFCRRFYQESVNKHFFVRFLNNCIGCLL